MALNAFAFAVGASKRRSRPLSRAAVRRRLRTIVGTLGARRIILYGSFARGPQTADSDVDSIVVADTRRRFLDRCLDILPALNRALKPHAVEPLIYTETA